MHFMSQIRLASLVLFLSLFGQASVAFERDALVVWINNDKGYNGLREVAQRFTADTGVRVIVNTQDDWDGGEDPANRFAKVAATSIERESVNLAMR